MGQVLTRIHDTDNGLTVERVQDVEPVLDGCHARRVSGMTGSSEMRHVASLPLVLVERYCNTHGITFNEFMSDTKHAKSMVNDPALAAFRIWEGKL